MRISEIDKKRILDASEGKLVELISDYVNLRKVGVSLVGKCPHCGDERGLTVTPAKNIFKCFKCNEVKGNSPVAYLMSGEKKPFLEALEILARKFTVILDEPKAKKLPTKNKNTTGSYCLHMLKESGLTTKDVTANVFISDINKTISTSVVFKPGTINEKFEIVKGDDVIIEYFDLDGQQVTYEKKTKYSKRTTTENFFRVRFKYPHEHIDKDGKPTKYKSPYGSTNQLYIPEAIRNLYRSKTKIERLFVQEGEKKAEKACKHGIPSVGISGINNLGQNGHIPQDLVRIIEGCEVKEIVLLFDSDWNQISDNIKLNDSVDKRPRNFFYAARNFRDYIRTLKNRDLYVEVYVGHVMFWNTNGRVDKGIDDLLANTLKEKEDELAKDISFLINQKNLTGNYIQLYKVTSWTDSKLEELWALNNPTAFAKMHKHVLSGLPEFRIGRHKWRFVNDDEIESAQPIEPDEQYWEEQLRADRKGNERKVYEFNYVRCFRFLQNRGFGRYKMLDDSEVFILSSQHEVRQVKHTEVRDFISEFTAMVANEDVLNMLYRGGPQYLGPDKLSNLRFIHPNFEKPTRELQRFYFEKTCWDITADGIKEFDYTAVNYQVWNDQKQNFQPSIFKYPLIDIQKNESGEFTYRVSQFGEKCHFLRFLINASNFTWKKRKIWEEDQTKIDLQELEREEKENIQHLVAKLAAIGYMLMTCKDRSVAKAVVAMDGKQSEVGQSNGRSGKSIVGEMFKQIMPTVFINGKNKDIETDAFIWDSVTEKTKIVFIDDVRTNFNIEFMFPNITGDWNVNYKGGRRAVIPFQLSPKIYIPTNHALNGKGSSFTDRMWIIAFSDFYNDTHRPVDDFGQLFFDEWEFEQWNLLWNLLAVCVQTYLRFGVVESPGERIELRNLRQQMGEEFLLWADEYFSSNDKINERIPRSVLSEEYKKIMANPKYFSAPKFKTQIQDYCKWKGYVFNPNKLDPKTGKTLYFDKDGNPNYDDKSGGVEYFTIGTPDGKPLQEQKTFDF